MKHSYIKVLSLLTFFTIILTGCGTSTPTGDSKDVKDLVIEISYDELFKQVFVSTFAQQNPKVPLMFQISNLEMTYENIVKECNSDENKKYISKAAVEAKKRIGTIPIELKNIRTDKVDDEIHKVFCSADLTVNQKSIPITYTAQINSDGNLYVAVYGL